MFETRGRKNIDVYVDGGYYIVKKPLKLNTALGVLLPKDWIESIAGGREVKYFLLDLKQTEVVIKPYFEELPMLASEGKE